MRLTHIIYSKTIFETHCISLLSRQQLLQGKRLQASTTTSVIFSSDSCPNGDLKSPGGKIIPKLWIYFISACDISWVSKTNKNTVVWWLIYIVGGILGDVCIRVIIDFGGGAYFFASYLGLFMKLIWDQLTYWHVLVYF